MGVVKATEPSPAQKPHRWFLLAVALAASVVLGILAPPFRVVLLKEIRATTPEPTVNTFNPHVFAETFWRNQLVPSITNAISARALDSALDASPQDAARRYAHRVGIGGMAYYYLSGEGLVASVDSYGVHLALAAGAKPVFILETGLIFGNALRDGTGLLDVNAFPSSDAFNTLAAELNRIAEERILLVLRGRLAVGERVHFAGVAEITGTDGDPRPLRIIPILVEVKQ
jgi:predicted lipoprotein